MRLYAMVCGHIDVPMDVLVGGEPGRITIPVPCYMIDHPKGLVIFDSGLRHGLINPGDAEHAIYRREIDAALLIGPGEDLAGRLAAIDRDVGEVRYLVNSHLHFDHCGGNEQSPNAEVIVQRREWEAGRIPEQQKANGYNPAHYDLGHKVTQVDGAHDLFGDGSVICVPSYGHTPGHQSLQVRLSGGDVVLTADACYFRSVLESLKLPRYVHDREAARAALLRLREMEAAGKRLFFGHDAEFWKEHSGAPIEIGNA